MKRQLPKASRADGEPAWKNPPPHITASMVARYGSYEAAKMAVQQVRA